MKRYCSNCGKLFDVTVPNQRFCGAACVKASTPKGHFIILERDGFQCVYCGRSPLRDRALLAVDHVHPVAEGGDDRAINLVTCCRNCNSQKGTRVFVEKLKRQLFAAIHDRNVAMGIDDNQQIDLGGTSADLRHDIETLSSEELSALIAQDGKGDLSHIFMARLQAIRLNIASLMEMCPEIDQQPFWEGYERFGQLMADIEKQRYSFGDSDPAFTESLFSLRDE